MADSANQTSAAAEGQAEAFSTVSNVTSQLLSSYEVALEESSKKVGFFVGLFPDLINQFKSRTCVMGRGHKHLIHRPSTVKVLSHKV